MVITLIAKGLTTGEVHAHLKETYGTDLSRETVSKITDRVLDDMNEWLSRPTNRVYPVVFIDAIIEDVCIVVCDGLKGLPEAIGTT